MCIYIYYTIYLHTHTTFSLSSHHWWTFALVSYLRYWDLNCCMYGGTDNSLISWLFGTAARLVTSALVHSHLLLLPDSDSHTVKQQHQEERIVPHLILSSVKSMLKSIGSQSSETIVCSKKWRETKAEKLMQFRRREWQTKRVCDWWPFCFNSCWILPFFSGCQQGY